MSAVDELERFDEAEIADICGVDLSLAKAPTMASLADAQDLVDTLWALAKVLLKKGHRAQDLDEQKESLKALLSSTDEDQVHQGVQLLKAMDDPELWQAFAAGISTESSKLEIGGLIKGWVQPRYQLHVALLVGQCAGIFTAEQAIDVSAYVDGLQSLPFQGTLGQAVWPSLKDTPLALTLYENTYPSARATDISALGVLTNLASLTLDNHQALRNLQPLASLTRLSTLSLIRCPQVRNLTPLQKLTSLTQLHHDGKNVRNLRPLEGLTNLTSLKLSSEALIKNLQPLAGLTSLTALTLGLGDRFGNLTPLAGLTELTALTLYSVSALRDLTPLQGLTSLQSLVIYDARVQSLQALHGLTALTRLSLGTTTTPIAEIQALQAALPGCRVDFRAVS